MTNVYCCSSTEIGPDLITEDQLFVLGLWKDRWDLGPRVDAVYAPPLPAAAELQGHTSAALISSTQLTKARRIYEIACPGFSERPSTLAARMMEHNSVTNYITRPLPQFHIDPPDHYTIVHPSEPVAALHDKENGNPAASPTDQPLLLRKTWVESPSWTGSYASEWHRLFGDLTAQRGVQQAHPIHLTQLRECAFTGQLRNCRFRSVCWRLHLGILPPDMRHWSMAITRHRRSFQEIDYVVNLDPHVYNLHDHPLSREKRSRWCHYFTTQDVKRVIAQDVDRTFPEVEYFRNPQVQHAMINVLYCYVEHTGADYKQGMHELLAPLFFVLHCDQIAFQHACETNAISAQLKAYLGTLLNDRYLEADAFVLFSHIMNLVQLWYANDRVPQVKPRTPVGDSDMPKLFCSELDFRTANNNNNNGNKNNSTNQHNNDFVVSNPGVAYVEEIHDKLLQKYNQDVYFHLKQLDIVPALFGLRWIRLLFGHEFPMQDLLYIWDCIFAAEDDFALVRYIYVSMLDYLGPSLLQMNYSDCLSHLMRFPQGVDVSYLVQMALHFYKPKQYAVPLHVQSPRPNTPGTPADSTGRKYRPSMSGRGKLNRSGSSAGLSSAGVISTAAAIATIGRGPAGRKSLGRRNTLLDTQNMPRLKTEQREVSKSSMSLNRLFLRDQSGRSTPLLGPRTAGPIKVEHKLWSRELHQRCQEVVSTCWNQMSAVVDELEKEMHGQTNENGPIHPTNQSEGRIRLDQLERLQIIQAELEKVVQWLGVDEEPPAVSPQTETDSPTVQPIRRAGSLNLLPPPALRPKSAQSGLIDFSNAPTGDKPLDDQYLVSKTGIYITAS
ncbi:unnamed protein product [Echinostoma caproni]|uniref:Rab-GAP TBC domain-containing protein n=1 Tax=Echinostoma caproni TaxID=27848 RepID=A0A183AEP6_9TREM|nr:unnamed protein product [Echinostoma caproni]